MERFTFGKKLSRLGWQFLFMNGSGLRSDSLKRSCLRGLFSAPILNQVLLQNGNVIKGLQGKGKKKKKDSIMSSLITSQTVYYMGLKKQSTF